MKAFNSLLKLTSICSYMVTHKTGRKKKKNHCVRNERPTKSNNAVRFFFFFNQVVEELIMPSILD